MSLRAGLEKLKGVPFIQWILPVIALGLLGSLLLSQSPAAAPSRGEATALEQRLAQVLSSIEGAGTVEVVIHTGSEAVVSAGAFGSAGTTAAPPAGVIVVAEGAGDLQVRLELSRAVQTLLGLPPAAVEVLKRESTPRR